MAKEKKKKKSAKAKGLKAEAAAPKARKAKAKLAKAAKVAKPGKRLKALTDSPVVAEVVAAALLATAAALKDSKKTRQLAEFAGDEVERLHKEGAERGSALWQLSLDVAKRTIAALATDKPSPAGKAGKAKPKPE